MAEQTPATTEAWTVGRLLRWTQEYLARAGIEEPRLCAELLLAHALSCAKIELYTRFEHQPAEEQRAALRELVRRAARHEPVAYLTGNKEFYSLAFEVNADVLIPRPETETLVERAIHACRETGCDPVHLLDMGTGSGCIAIAILSQVPHARAVGTDISGGALEVAGRNAERHGVSDRLRLIEVDRLNLPADCIPDGGFDLIVSNPPYIASDDAESLPPSVRDFEPHTSLFAEGDGLTFYRALHEGAARLLGNGGSVLVEVGAGLSDSVRALMEEGPALRHIGTWRDATDPHERVLGFIKGKQSGNGNAATPEADRPGGK